MPTSAADAFAAAGSPKPLEPTIESESPAKIGETATEVFQRLPKTPTLKDRLAPVVRAAKTAFKESAAGEIRESEAATKPLPIEQYAAATAISVAKPYMEDYRQMVNNYRSALEADAKRVPEGTAGHILDLGQKLMDLLGYYTVPVTSPLYTSIIKPAQAAVNTGRELVQRHTKDAAYDAQKQREGIPYPKGSKGFSLNAADVDATADFINQAIEAATLAGVSFIGPKEVPTVERPIASARTALQDLKSAVTPPEPKLTPIALSLDKSMGFQKVTDVVGKELNSLPAGSTRSAVAVLDSMIPHAEGYAKDFLTRLAEKADPTVPVRFKAQAGTDPRFLGVYTQGLHQIEIKQGEPDIVHTTVHEIVHSNSVSMLNQLIEGELKSLRLELGRDLTAEETVRRVNKPVSPVLRELDGIIAEARIRASKAGRMKDYNVAYGLMGGGTGGRKGYLGITTARMSPRYEFIAESFSNPIFQEFLANSEKFASVGYKWRNMLTQLGTLIGRHLGITRPGELQLLHQSMNIGERLIRMQSELKPSTSKDILEIVARPAEGGTITRGDIRSATETGKLIDPAGVRKAKTSLQISIEQILRAVSPESLGRNAKLAAAAIASRITERMQRDAYWQHGSSTRLKFWRARPDMTREFIDKFEKGGGFSDSVLQNLAERYRDWGKRIAEHDAKLGFDYDPRENYLAHIFEDQDGVAEYFSRKYGSKWGDPSFVKDRTFNLYKEAIEAGFRPRFDNPEDIMLARQHASDIATMHTDILKDLEKYGLATLKVVGKEELKKTFDSEGRASFNIVKTEGTKQPPGSVRWRAPNGDVYWLDPRADAVMQNAFKSKSLWEDRGLGGTLFRGAMSLKNALVPIRLALSLFHPLHVIGIDASAGITRALSGMLSGTTPIHKGLAEMLSNGLFYKSIWENPKSGWRVMKAWQGKIPASELTEADARALQTLVEMGISPDMSVQYRTNARKNFINAFRDAQANFRMGRPLGGAGDVTRAVWHLPWATVSALSKPIFEVWIPALKAASALKDAENLLKRSPELAENDAARHLAMRRLGKSVENRYGEMNYSTLFWKRWVKDLSVLDTLSLGWQLGFIREYGGGMMDLGQWVKNSDKMQQIKRGQLDKAIFVASYTTLGAAVGGLMTWAMTGTPPTSLLDYISPRTGEKNPDGSDSRVSTMFYHREFASLYKHIQNEGVVPGVSELVLNKGSGLFGLMHEWATGVNGFGQEIRDPEGDAFQKLEQTLAYTLSDLEPISMQAIQKNAGVGAEDTALEKVGKIAQAAVTTKSGALSALGFTPAPKYLTESTTTAHIKQAFSNYVAPRQTPFEKAEFSKEYSQLRAEYQQGSEQFGLSLGKFVEKNQLSDKDQRRLIKSLNSTLLPEQRMFMRLPWTEQIKILNKATPEERSLLLPHANREHVRNQWTPPE